MRLKVNEIFYSLQGEGSRAGLPSIFIRLSGCDLSCGFCDTEFESGVEKTPEELLEMLKDPTAYSGYTDVTCDTIVWTGGEPGLQLTKDIVEFFNNNGYKQCVETNGNHSIPLNLHLISISPKVAEHVIAKNFALFKAENRAELVAACEHQKFVPILELRYVRHKGQIALPEPSIMADYYYLSPMFDGNNINVENTKHCIDLILKNPNSSKRLWQLSVQLHKLIGVL